MAAEPNPPGMPSHAISVFVAEPKAGQPRYDIRKPARRANSFGRIAMTDKNAVSRKIVLALCAALLLPSLAACNTVKGAGKDIEKGGEAIQDGAEDVQQDM
jgi:predicted small secreted protein